MHGFAGRILWVDLTEGRSYDEELTEDVYQKFLAGYGLGAYILYRDMAPNTDPLGPDAIFGFVAGLFTGHGIPFSGRTTVCAKSPLSNTWGDSNSGGSLGSNLKRLGYDGLFIKGQSDTLIYLEVTADGVALKDAAHLAGKSALEATDILRGDEAKFHGGVAAIGPAGEAQARIASIAHDKWRQFGRQGLGAVLGSKKVKAVVVIGADKAPSQANADEVARLCQEVIEPFQRDPSIATQLELAGTEFLGKRGALLRMVSSRKIASMPKVPSMIRIMHKYGTTSGVAMGAENGDAPVKNWQGVGSRDFPIKSMSKKISDAEVSKYRTEYTTCGDCPLVCMGLVEVKDGKYKTAKARRPDYETLSGFGTACLNDNIESIIKSHDVCNQYGVDAVSTSAAVAYAMDLYDKGIITKEDVGYELNWGDADVVLRLTEEVCMRTGWGAVLSDGIKIGSERLGPEALKHAVHIHGVEPPYHDPKYASSFGTAFVSDPTPGRHTSGNMAFHESFGLPFPFKGIDLPETKWGESKGTGVPQAAWSNAHQSLNGSGLCMFSMIVGGMPMVEFINALTGWSLTEQDVLDTGERIQQLRHAFNTREGLKPGDFELHPYMTGGPGASDGPLKGVQVDIETLVGEYHAAMAWNLQDGRVSKDRAEKLGIADVLAANDGGVAVVA